MLRIRIRIRMDPFYFGLPDPDLFHVTDPKSAKIIGKKDKNQPKLKEYHIFKQIFYFFVYRHKLLAHR